MAEGRVRERWKDGGETEVHVEETRHGVPCGGQLACTACSPWLGTAEPAVFESLMLGMFLGHLVHWSFSGSCLFRFFFPHFNVL